MFSCNNGTIKENEAGKITTDSTKIKQMEWVIGSWENLSVKGDLYETWTKIDDSTFAGRSFMIVQNDTAFSEKISLEFRNKNLFYIPTVRNQNKELPVLFKLISIEKGELIFENKEHDFPQRIIYKNPSPDSLYARIEGKENGELKKEEFAMTRRK
ncbi:MAG: hypothetical protein A3F72_07805 [Bacteroidetes bacterium RIFCSPLOWO2_12_FULL_35_15]|nr:MAG: hypothetical protein A3F72_07805 [Bacteroidetes bacterium RIFCSPLOWO2_12_FULL_35_15]